MDLEKKMIFKLMSRIIGGEVKLFHVFFKKSQTESGSKEGQKEGQKMSQVVIGRKMRMSY